VKPRAIAAFVAPMAAALALLALGIWKGNIVAVGVSLLLFIATPMIFAAQLNGR
jgi:hypothetical protein